MLATTGTRLKILALLHKGGASVGQLALQLALANATIRRHLDVLQRDRLVDYFQSKKKLGRPEYIYSLTEEGQETLPKHYPQLLIGLLNEIGSLTTDEIRGLDGNGLSDLVFKKLASRSTGSSESDDEDIRISYLLQVLLEGDFLPEVERTGKTIRIHLNNCPFRSVALKQEIVCHVDRNIIENVLQVPIDQEHCIRKGDHNCSYVTSVRD